MAVKAFKRDEVSRIILTRPAVEAGENLGFLPGDLKDKVDPYLRPLYETSAGSQKKQESSRKTSVSALLTMQKPLTVWITINCGKFFKRWEYQTT